MACSQRSGRVFHQDPDLFCASEFAYGRAAVDQGVVVVISREDLVVDTANIKVSFVLSGFSKHYTRDLNSLPLEGIGVIDIISDADSVVCSERVLGSHANSMLVPCPLVTAHLVPCTQVRLQVEVLDDSGLLASSVDDGG